MPHPAGFPPLLAVVTVLICAGLFAAFWQALFPRPARWRLIGIAFVLGGALIAVLAVALRPTADRLSEITDLWSALRIVVLSVGLPEEAVKLAAAMAALFLFRRTATPAEAFQAALLAAFGFSAVENALYARAFQEWPILIAGGRGVFAGTIHSLMAMIQGTFLATFVATGWRRWHLPALGWLLASAAHAGFDWGMLQPAVEYMRQSAANADPATIEMAMIPIVMQNLPVLAIGVPAPFVIGLWLLRRTLRRIGAADPRAADPTQLALRARWRRIGSVLIAIGLVALAGSVIAALVVTAAMQGQPQPEPFQGKLMLTVALAGSPMLVLYGWLARQKQ